MRVDRGRRAGGRSAVASDGRSGLSREARPARDSRVVHRQFVLMTVGHRPTCLGTLTHVVQPPLRCVTAIRMRRVRSSIRWCKPRPARRRVASTPVDRRRQSGVASRAIPIGPSRWRQRCGYASLRPSRRYTPRRRGRDASRPGPPWVRRNSDVDLPQQRSRRMNYSVTRRQCARATQASNRPTQRSALQTPRARSAARRRRDRGAIAQSEITALPNY